MLGYPNCPKCGSQIISMDVKPMDAQVFGGNSYKGAAYVCPHCNSVISFQIDPVAVSADEVNDLKRSMNSMAEQLGDDIRKVALLLQSLRR